MIKSTPTLRTRVSGSYAEDASQAGGRALDNTREFAAQALERAADKLRDLRYGMADTATAAQHRVGQAADATTRYVSQQPVKSALIAAAVGAAVAGVILMARRRNSRY